MIHILYCMCYIISRHTSIFPRLFVSCATCKMSCSVNALIVILWKMVNNNFSESYQKSLFMCLSTKINTSISFCKLSNFDIISLKNLVSIVVHSRSASNHCFHCLLTWWLFSWLISFLCIKCQKSENFNFPNAKMMY